MEGRKARMFAGRIDAASHTLQDAGVLYLSTSLSLALGGGLGTGRSHGGLGGASNAGSPYANYVGGGGQDLQQRWRRENGLESMAMAPW